MSPHTDEFAFESTVESRCCSLVAGRRARPRVEMKAILGVLAQEARAEDEDWQDGMNAVASHAGPQPNLSFFAFTPRPRVRPSSSSAAPPSGRAGVVPRLQHAAGEIEEGFILDVLQNYIDYNTYYRLAKQAADDPNVPKRRTAVALAKT